MPALHEKLRKQLEKTVIAARDIAEDAAREALKRLAVDQPKLFDHMTPDERKLRNKLWAKAKQLGDQLDAGGKRTIDHLVIECAYEHWHRMLFARFLAENHLLIHDEEGVPVSLEECEELAKEEGTDGWALAARFASRMLPQIFPPDDPVLAVTLAPESKRALEKILDTLPPEVFTADDSLGWVYQFWQNKRKDEVNASGDKIGADELPAVTQLFTEHYMVLFLLHNTLGAWWAGKVLGDQANDQSRDREGADREELSEDEWRKRVALPGYEFDYLRFRPDGTPAAGTFSGWPTEAKDLKILDPCCGSGHFLVASFDLMVRVRMKEEGLPPRDACDAVLRDNIFGLEIDPRCTQIAAFALALAAWRFCEAGGYRELPELHIACSGIGPHATEEQWIKLAEQSGIPMPTVGREAIKNGLLNLHQLFSQAATLGSLINPAELPADLIAADYETIQPYLATILSGEKADDETRERAIAAAGMVKAAELLASEYTLVVTNVPYLGRGNQDETLKTHLEERFKKGKKDLATAFVLRCLAFCSKDGTAALVTPQNWLFLTTYTKLRQTLLKHRTWNAVVRLGPGAFETIGGHVVNVALLALSATTPDDNTAMVGIDVSTAKQPSEKAAQLCGQMPANVAVVPQTEQLENPDHRIILAARGDHALMLNFANSWQGIKTSDDPRFTQQFWEQVALHGGWHPYQRAPESACAFAGRAEIIYWEDGRGKLTEVCQKGASFRGQSAWGRQGVAVHGMAGLTATLYSGEIFSSDVSIIDPKDQTELPAIWAYCSSKDFSVAVRTLDQKLGVTNSTMTKVSFDLAHWQQVATEKYPSGLPEPESDDPTQWLFHGRPDSSNSPLQVGVARLVGYQWPAELDEKMTLSKRARELVGRCAGLRAFTDDDGIACISAVRGERGAADRVRAVLAGAYDDEWSPALQEELLASLGFGGKSLDEWLRNGFFEQHCKLFRNRPFIWHVWDGRKKDGFGALVNYHKLDQKLLDRLIYTYLGDWIKRQEQAVAQNESGADARLLAAQQLQAKLKLIAEGKPPFDIFVRWKPLEEQPIGWNPDLNDGVRMNIRPFMEANILRKKPNIKWKKDRGKEPERSREQYPWFWGWDEKATDFAGGSEFTAERFNDLHYTNDFKRAAREKADQTARQQTA